MIRFYHKCFLLVREDARNPLLRFLLDRKPTLYRQVSVSSSRNPTHLSGEDVLPGFILDLKQIF